jgi:hypothetical protein
VNDDGSFVNMVDVTRFPVAKDMAGALVRIAPGEHAAWVQALLLRVIP